MPGDYARIEKALAFIVENAGHQPGLDELAAACGLSPFHFQRVFTRWVGISPKKFLQHVTLVREMEEKADEEGAERVSLMTLHAAKVRAPCSALFRGCHIGVLAGGGDWDMARGLAKVLMWALRESADMWRSAFLSA